MAGDLHVRVETQGYLKTTRDVHDANSRPSGDMTSAVRIGSRTVYMTEAGAQAIRDYREIGYNFDYSAHNDTRKGGLLDLYRTISNLPLPEKNTGRP